MGEAKRRLEMIGTATITLEEYEKLPTGCAWGGCHERFTGDMPIGWVWLLAYWTARPNLHVRNIDRQNWARDAALCPRHMRELDGLLKAIPDPRLYATGSKQ